MSSLLTKAVIFSANAHNKQIRKVDKSPYILHPMEAAVIAGSLTADEEIIAAALLHDTVEDTPTTSQEIFDNFGSRIASYVSAETENKRKTQNPADTWKIRKQESLLDLKNTADRNVHILWMADKLSNLRSMYRAYLQLGDSLFAQFNQKNKAEHAWYYKTIGEYLKPLQNTPAYEEYIDLVHKIFD